MVLFNFCQLSKAQLVPFRVVSRGYYKAHFPKFNMQSHVGLKKTKLVDQYSLKGSNVFQSQNTSLQSRHGLIKVFRKLIKKNCKEGSPKLLGINQNCGLALGFGTVLVASCQQFTRASCHSNNGETSTRLLEKKIVETAEKSADFDLWLFLQFLRPDLLLILLSVLSAITVAFINIQIPVFLGDLVQVVSHFTHEYSGDYLKEIKTPAVKLVSAYSLQVCAVYQNKLREGVIS
ncbi:ATP-binding cassette sub-family B member 8, mitochondrial [Holothuria leucospilota]|uniref:ATP-binding cassette sub-family B member 8, mitochondrial n=1 Tax=Holothuria leucospilota TaxID=206669 RepID=A0A9Q1CQ82_HOLLE|nr:ATP-binding cassette sub-family B member 8, mitochondrial [Holothuria leucospilota]